MEVKSNVSKVALRTLTAEDADAIAEHANDYDVVYNIAELGSFPFPYERSDALRFIDAATHASINGTEFHYAILLKSTDELVGAGGIKNIDLKNKKCEIGYWIGKKFWDKGYGKDAVSLLIHIAFTSLGMNRVYATVFAFNERSLNLLRSLGFSSEGIMRQNVFHSDKFIDDIILSLLKSEYKPAGEIKITADD